MEEDHARWGRLKDQLEDLIRTYPKVYHVFWKPQHLLEPEEVFMSKWKIIHDFKCDCIGTCEHSHMIAVWNANGVYSRQKFKGMFAEKKAFNVTELLNDTPNGTKRIISTVLYIQTEHGWHKKTGHLNPNLLSTLQDNIEWHVGYFKDHMWAQVEYARYLLKKIAKYNAILLKFDQGECDLTPSRLVEIINLKETYMDRVVKIENQYGPTEHVNQEHLIHCYKDWMNTL